MGHLTRIRICFYIRSRGEFLRERSPGNGSFRWMFPRYSKEWAAVIRDERNTVYRRRPFFNANVSNTVDGPRGPAEVEAASWESLVGRRRILNRSPFSANLRPFFENSLPRRSSEPVANPSAWKFIYKRVYIFRFASFREEVMWTKKFESYIIWGIYHL